MDFILPSDDTMELMREEFAKLKCNESARAFALADEKNIPQDTSPDRAVCDTGIFGTFRTYISSALLLLYFVKHMGYNMEYGTQIFNTDRGLEQLQRVGNIFGQLNNLG